ncbi:MAG: HAMP domain-containing histidine kinase [Spirochaetes bacterium]|jgi:signal transduction histidine kinase|nr:HAMP domain-containing histidine kinase [Spirochaetota bacterium]
MKLKLSIFTRLFGIIVATALLVNLLIGAYFGSQFRFNRRDSFLKNMDAYADYMIRDLGLPPDRAKAERLARETTMNIAVEGPGINWATAPLPPPPEHPRPAHRTPRGSFGWDRGTYFYETERASVRYRFWGSARDIPEGGGLFLYLFLGLVSTVMIGAYLIIRRILSPIRLLADGVKQTAAGNFDHRVPVGSADELGELAASFNAMNEKITAMLASREQLLRDVSHELRSPLTRMRVALELMPEGAGRQSVLEDVATIDAMIAELLETQRLERPEGSPRRERMDLKDALYAVIREFGGDRSTITSDLPDGPLVISADRERVMIVLRNILGNALKYSPAGRPVEVAARSDGSGVLVSVRDRGRGIPEEELGRVFEPFYRVDRSRSRETGGYGLGLHICRRIVEAHGGTIAVRNRTGGGAEVEVWFGA